MQIRGWVYIFSNKAMPGLVKIGYSTKDPLIRAEELQGNGLPYPYFVDYDMLVEGPREVEQQVHAELVEYHESKGFFRIATNTAKDVMRNIVASQGKIVLCESEAGVLVRPQGPYRCSSSKGCFATVAEPGELCGYHSWK
jgi:hypothetical protein